MAKLTHHSPASETDLDQMGIEIVHCDASGRPRHRRIVSLAACLGLAPRGAEGATAS